MLAGWRRPAHQDAQSETGGAAARTKPSSCSEAEPLPPPHPHALVVSPPTRAGEASAGAQLRAAPQGAQPTAPMGTSAPPAALTGIISAAASQKMHFFIEYLRASITKVFFFFFPFKLCMAGGCLHPWVLATFAPLQHRSCARQTARDVRRKHPEETPSNKNPTAPNQRPRRTGRTPALPRTEIHPVRTSPLVSQPPSPHSCRYLPA